MEHYYFNINVDEHGRHEVHTESCQYLEPLGNRTYIGYFDNCQEAIRTAKAEHPWQEFDGCYWCSYECHKG